VKTTQKRFISIKVFDLENSWLLTNADKVSMEIINLMNERTSQ